MTLHPFLISILTVAVMMLGARQYKYTWAVGVGLQGMWLAYVLLSGEYGFLIMITAMLWVYSQNTHTYKRTLRQAINDDEDDE